MAVFDRSRPHCRVYGTPGAVYEQDGHTFNSVGREVQIIHVPERNGSEAHTIARLVEPELPKQVAPPPSSRLQDKLKDETALGMLYETRNVL